jgi:hypothetical protein
LDSISKNSIMEEFGTAEKTVLDEETIERLQALGCLDN